MFSSLERLAVEALLSGKRGEARLRTEVAMERAAERVLAISNSVYSMVVQGSSGTGALFQGVYQLRREKARLEARSWSPEHEHLFTSYDEVVREANQALDDEMRVPYGKLRQAYDAHLEAAPPSMFQGWEQEYAPQVVRQTLTLLMSELHQAAALDDKCSRLVSQGFRLGRQRGFLLDMSTA